MKTLQFKSANGHESQFAEEVKRKVSEYFKYHHLSIKGNLWVFLKALVILSIYIVPWILIITIPLTSWMGLFLCLVIGIGEAGVGMSVMHDAAHGALSRKKWVNTLFESSMYLLGSNMFNWKIQHNLYHHTYTNIYGYDPDIGTKVVIRLCEHAKLRKYHRYQFIYSFFLYGLMTLSKIVLDIVQLFEFNKSGITKLQKANPRRELWILLISKTLYFFIFIGLPIIFSSFNWWQVLLGFGIMHITAGMIMSTIFQMAHVVEGAQQPLPDSNRVIPHEWLVHQLMSTSDFDPNNRILSWYIGGLNYQIEHHLFPNICHVHYRKIAPIVRITAEKYGIKYNLKPTFRHAFISHVRRLKELGRENKILIN
jgi:linoleoyl-CoA desaturase